MAKIVIDTNCLLQCLPSKSKYHDLWLSIGNGKNSLCVTTSILEEYHEILAIKTTPNIASIVISIIINNKYTNFVEPYFSFNLIEADSDDNKFVDCAVAANADFIITEDKHFNILREIDFPRVEIISLDQWFRNDNRL